MIDLGIDKLALIGAVALIVIGPERLPRVARTMGVLLGKAQRYMSQVQAEVKQSMEVEELRKMQGNLQEAASSVQQQVQGHMDSIQQNLHQTSAEAWALPDHDGAGTETEYHSVPYVSFHDPVRKNWRIKRTAMPLWYKQRNGVRRHVQSGAARVARFRPPGQTRQP